MSRPDLEALIAAERPVPRPAFTAELDARVAAGFGRAAAAPAGPRRRWRLPRPGILAPALAGVAALVLAFVLVHGGGRPVGVTGGPASSSSADGVAAGTSRSLPAPGAGSAAAAGGSPFHGRNVERATRLVLGVRPARMQRTAQRIYRVVGAFGGIVDSSSVSSTGGAGSGATFALRIPAVRSGAAVARLAALGRVRSQTSATTDVTGSFVTARESLRAAEAERAGLLRSLTGATSATAVDALKQRLRLADGRISSARRELRRLHGRVDYARVNLELTPTGPAPARPTHGSGGGYTPRDALEDAGRILRVAAAVALVVLLLSLPVLALGGGATVAGRRLRRRRREAALG